MDFLQFFSWKVCFFPFYISVLKRGKNPVKNGVKHKKPERKGEKGLEKVYCERT
jgi:hypothetical protein